MARASILLPNGTKVDIDGTPDEVAALLALYGQAGGSHGGEGAAATKPRSARKPAKRKRVTSSTGAAAASQAATTDPALLTSIVNHVKNGDEAASIEQNVLDKTSQVDRTLLPLYIVHDYLENKFGLTSGDVSKVTTQLGIPISQPNASKTLSGTASRYVMADTVRKKGVPVRYKLTRRGQQYMKAVVTGKGSEDAK